MPKTVTRDVEFPDDGDVYEDPNNPQDPPEDSPVDPPAPNPANELAALNDRLARQERELEELRKRTPPPTPKDPAPRPQADDFNWDEELFRNPRKTLEKHGQMVAEQVTKQLTSQYQRDRGTQKFWEEFYEKHPDLKQDHDLIEVTLNSNLSKLATMQVPDAIERLAELTRDRILRYAGGAAKSRTPRARAEGAKGTVSPTPPKEPEAPKILSISEILRKRKDDRRKKAAGV